MYMCVQQLRWPSPLRSPWRDHSPQGPELHTHLPGQSEDCSTKQQYTQQLSLHCSHHFFSVPQILENGSKA